MKKVKKLLCLFALAAAIAPASKVNAQAVSKGSIIIDPYYGFPNFGKSIADDIQGTGLTVKGLGPCGLRFEYMVADKLGLGVDFIYNSYSVSYDDTVSTYNSSTNQYESNTYNYKLGMQRIRPQVRLNYHFVRTDAVDSYIGFGAGGNIRTWSAESTEPNFEDTSDQGTLLPVSMRIALGTRFYFTDNIGLNLELGLGGPVLSTGLSVKF